MEVGCEGDGARDLDDPRGRVGDARERARTRLRSARDRRDVTCLCCEVRRQLCCASGAAPAGLAFDRVRKRGLAPVARERRGLALDAAAAELASGL